MSRTALYCDLVTPLEALASIRPLVLVVENLHASDPETLDALAFLAASDDLPGVARRRLRAAAADVNRGRPLDEALGQIAGPATASP